MDGDRHQAGHRGLLVDRAQYPSRLPACGRAFRPSSVRGTTRSSPARARRRPRRGSQATRRAGRGPELIGVPPPRSPHRPEAQAAPPDELGAHRADKLHLAGLVDEHPAALREQLPASVPAAEQRRLREGLRLERVGAERGHPDDPGPGGLAGARVEKVVRKAAVGSAPDRGCRRRSSRCRRQRRRRSPPPRGRSGGGHGRGTDRVGVRSHRRGRRRRSRPRSGNSRAAARRAGRRPAPCRCRRCRSQPRAGAGSCPASSSTSNSRHSASGRGAQDGAPERGRGHPPRAPAPRPRATRVAGGDDRPEQGRVHEPARPLGGPEPGPDGSAEELRGLYLGARILVERRQLAVLAKAGEGRVEPAR